MKMKYWIPVGMLALPAMVHAEEKPAVQTQEVRASIVDEVKEISGAHDAQVQEVYKKIRSERDRSKRSEIFKEMPDPVGPSTNLLDLAKKDLRVDGVEQALSWVSAKGSPQQRKEAAELLMKAYPESKGFERYINIHCHNQLGLGVEALREVVAGVKEPGTLAFAKYALANQLLMASERNRALDDEQKAASRKEGVEILEKLGADGQIKEHSPKVAKQIESRLFKVKHLSIGSEAPDIVGVDQDGEAFKLSDYRGKVVLIDFWGHW
ncbi:peroxiredoxin family protein [Rubritalea tangerina]|uniref:Peroxiredoxin family protein n=1 Tax=Rubritalea tangerina TaxID=430798 RepID=A0ABW4ZB81_9BACT